MPEQWMQDLMGEEERPRIGFEDELAAELRRGWGASPTPSPWRKVLLVAAAVALVVAGVAVLTGRDDAGTVTPGPSSTPRSNPDVTTSAGPAGSRYVAFGSMVMMGAADELKAAGVVVDAEENRGNQGLIDALTEATESGVIGSTSTVLLQLGQNQAFTGDDARAVLDAVPTTVRHVVVMTVTGPAVWTDAANEVIRTMRSADGYVTLADWAKFVADNGVELCPDGVHVSCSGQARGLYAYFVSTALKAAPDPVSVTTTPTDPSLADGPARPVKEYAAALASGDWMAAATLLGEGGEEWTTRADLRPLYRNEFGLRRADGSLEGLAAALSRWCTRAACSGSIESINEVDGDGSWFSVAMSGQGNFSLYRVITFEGQAGVRGLPQAGQGGGGPDYTGSGTLCPTDLPIERTAWADIDGDGWLELLVAQVVNTPTDESGIVDYRIVVCGSLLSSPPIVFSADGLSISVVPAFGSTPETLLIGAYEGYLSGAVYQAINGVWVQRKNTDGVPVTFAVHPPIQDQPGESVGCETFDGVEQLVRYDYTIAGDTVSYHYSNLVGLTTFDVDNTAVVESEDAVRVQTGVCNGLPVITN